MSLYKPLGERKNERGRDRERKEKRKKIEGWSSSVRKVNIKSL